MEGSRRSLTHSGEREARAIDSVLQDFNSLESLREKSASETKFTQFTQFCAGDRNLQFISNSRLYAGDINRVDLMKLRD